MKRARVLILLLLLCLTSQGQAQEFVSRLGERLSFSAFNDNLRVRVSGTLDLEYYRFGQPAPGVIYAEGEDLLNPRLSVFVDAQLGAAIYFFAQARVDRHFDPSDEGAQLRLDEYALRITPWRDGRLSIQVGQFGAIVGNWIPRHLSWENPFITAPLVYENVTILEDGGVHLPDYFVEGRLQDEKYEYLPLIWGPSYATGVSIAGRLGIFEYAAEVKNASLSSRPESWSVTQIGFSHPTVNARVGLRPNELWNVGFSASRGPYFRPEAAAELPPGRGIGDYQQLMLGQDVSFAWRHLQVWAEAYQMRFEVPFVGDADSFSYHVEVKYKFTPQFFGAVRWNQQFFGDIRDENGRAFPWWHDLARLDLALIYRITEQTQVKVQYNVHLQQNDRWRYDDLFAAQLTVKF